MEYPEINPVAFNIGIPIYWYAITYLVGIGAAFYLMTVRSRYEWYSSWDSKKISDLVFWGAIGMIVGGRVVYVLFYDFASFSKDPTVLFQIRNGGMAFHGGLLGVVVAMWLYGRSIGQSLFQVADFVAPVTPIGLGAGRIGNFINGELWGGPTDVAWGMKLKCAQYQYVYPQFCPKGATHTPLLHPSQLYEFMLEGVVLFIVLWFYARKQRPLMSISGLFLLCYGTFRFLVEFVRMPDAQLGYLFLEWVTMGQILSFPMILVGAYLIWRANQNPLDTGAPAQPANR